MTNQQKLLFTSFAVAILLLGCGETKEKSNSVTSATENSATNNGEEQTGASSSESGEPVSTHRFDQADFIDKYNKYINFSNSFNGRVYDSYNRYLSWADFEKGPKANPSGVSRGLYTLFGGSIKTLEKAISEKPEISEVDSLMNGVLEKAKALHKITTEADTYYKREDYKDDDFEKGQTMHPQLLKAFEDYFIVYEAMNVEFAKLQEALLVHEAKRYQENGQLIKYNMMMSLNHAEGILGLVGQLNGPELKNIDMTAFEDRIEQFRSAFDEFDKLSKEDSEQMKKEFGNYTIPPKMNIKSFNDAGSDMIKATRNLKERIAKNDFKYSITHPSVPDDGSPEKINKAYEKLINAYNRMN